MAKVEKIEKLSTKSKKENPIAVLKPSSVEKDDNIYSVRRELFNTSPENIKKLINSLNDIESEEIKKIAVESGYFDVIGSKEKNAISQNESEKTAIDRNCNILGGVFLEFLKSQKVTPGITIGKATIKSNDVEFIETLYPDLIDFFENPNKLDEKQINFARGVIYNNTGSFMVIDIENDVRIFPQEILDKLFVLKKLFRKEVKESIPYNKQGTRCNLIHTPRNSKELESHKRLFLKRIKSKK